LIFSVAISIYAFLDYLIFQVLNYTGFFFNPTHWQVEQTLRKRGRPSLRRDLRHRHLANRATDLARICLDKNGDGLSWFLLAVGSHNRSTPKHSGHNNGGSSMIYQHQPGPTMKKFEWSKCNHHHVQS
jgi:hypothetical protein